MPIGRRILSRIQSTPSTTHKITSTAASTGTVESENMIPLATMVVVPKHAHLPEIPGDSNLSFELMVYLYGITVMSLQYINLYKTVWWLPHSHSIYALNFYLIDPYLAAFLAILMSRRLVWCFVEEVYGSRAHFGFFYWCVQLVKIGIGGVLCISLIFTGYFVVTTYSPLYILFLAYPLATYVILFGPQLKPIYHRSLMWPSAILDKAPVVKQKTKDPCLEPSLFHNCTLTPDVVREEVEVLKTDFNNRIKQVLFNSMLTAYYMAFVPLCFAQNTLYYDVWWVGQHVCLSWLSAFLMFTIHFFPPKYLDLMHKCALHLGRWQKVEGRHAHVPYNAWSELQVWPQGALVKHVRGLFKAEGINVSAEPGNSMHGRFYFLFHQPLGVMNGLLTLTAALVGYEFLRLVQSTEWCHVTCLALVLFWNYYTLFKLLRDRKIFGKTYKEEENTSL